MFFHMYMFTFIYIYLIVHMTKLHNEQLEEVKNVD